MKYSKSNIYSFIKADEINQPNQNQVDIHNDLVMGLVQNQFEAQGVQIEPQNQIQGEIFDDFLDPVERNEERVQIHDVVALLVGEENAVKNGGNAGQNIINAVPNLENAAQNAENAGQNANNEERIKVDAAIAYLVADENSVQNDDNPIQNIENAVENDGNADRNANNQSESAGNVGNQENLEDKQGGKKRKLMDPYLNCVLFGF